MSGRAVLAGTAAALLLLAAWATSQLQLITAGLMAVAAAVGAALLTRSLMVQLEQVRSVHSAVVDELNQRISRLEDENVGLTANMADLRLSLDSRLDPVQSQIDRMGASRAAKLEEIDQRIDRIQAEYVALGDQLDGRQSLQAGLERLTVRFDAMRRRQSLLQSKLSTAHGGLETSAEQIERKRSRQDLSQVRDDLAALSTLVDKEQVTWRRALDRERSQRVRGFALRDGRDRNPTRWILLISIPRTGSTWLFDALRCHPAIEFEPTAVLFQRFELNGGRYPQGLANVAEGLDVEIARGVGATVPIPSVTPDLQGVYSKWSVEKLHPEFFAHDVGKMLGHLDELESEGNEIVCAYQIRRPDETLNSFLSYKERDPTWLSRLSNNEIPAYLESSYATLLDLARRRPGPVIDYDRLLDRPICMIHHIYRVLWPQACSVELERVASWASVRTDLEERRRRQPSTFYGDTDQHRPPAFPATPELQVCQDLYEELLALADDSVATAGPRIDSL